MSDDLISKQAAINAMCDACDTVTAVCPHYPCKRFLAIESLPSAQLKKGKWIKATGMMPPEFHGHHCCSECGNFANMEPPFGNREDLSKFCPNCGADMRGEQNDND